MGGQKFATKKTIAMGREKPYKNRLFALVPTAGVKLTGDRLCCKAR
jgi:hypothetical protein